MRDAALIEIDAGIEELELKLKLLRMGRELLVAATKPLDDAHELPAQPKPKKVLALRAPKKAAAKKVKRGKKAPEPKAAAKTAKPQPADEEPEPPVRKVRATAKGNGWVQELGAKEAQAWDLLTSMPSVSVDSIEAIFGPGQARHQGIFKLKGKIEASTAKTISWPKTEGYQLVDRDV